MSKEVLEDIHTQVDKWEPQFVQFIRERLGIDIHAHQLKNLHKIIIEAHNIFNFSPDEYYHHLANCDDESPYLKHLITGITIGETYFFRDRNQMNLLKEVILPSIIKMKREQNNLSLRIWSAGCATGEEIYSIAILLKEILKDEIHAWTINLLATDLNAHSLKKAIEGCYSEWAMRSINPYYKKRYFILDQKHFILSSEIREMVNFEYLNLNDNNYPSIFNGTNTQDLIVCRNVLIYFDAESSKKLMKKIYASLVPGGYLLLGASDPINISETHFIFHHDKGLLFSRPLEEKQISVIIPEIQNIPRIEKRIDIKHKPIKYKTKNLHLATSVKKTRALVSEDVITTLLQEGRWKEILNQLSGSEIKSVILINAKAMALANLGKLDEAAKLCIESFKMDPVNKHTYFIYALTLLELNKLSEAEVALRKLLYLDNRYVVGHFQLGLLLLRKKQQEAGLKSLRNALSIVESIEPEKRVPGSQGLNYGRMAEILKNEINLHKNV